MIGGRVLDVSAIVGFCTGQSVYAEALVMTAIEENIVLSIPAALARACGVIPRGHELGVDVLLGLPCAIVDPLDTAQARALGALVGQSGDPDRDIAAAHVVHCAQQRGWPVVTNDPEPLLSFDSSIEIESLP